MRVLTHLDKDSRQDLAINAALLISELRNRYKATDLEIKNIVQVADQMARIAKQNSNNSK